MEELEKQIKQKELNLIHGGQVMEKAAKQNAELKFTEQQLLERQLAEEKLKQDLKNAEETENYMNQQYKSQQEELDSKTSALKKLWDRYKSKEQLLLEIQEEFAAEREELMDNLRELTQQIRFRDVILETYVPLSVLQLIEERAEWDSLDDNWVIPCTEYAGNNFQRNEIPEGEYVPPPVSIEQMARLLHGSSFDPSRDMDSIQTPQMQEIYMSAAVCTFLY